MIKYKNCNIKKLQVNITETRTYEDFSKFLGTKPSRLGIVSRMYEDCTASYLTESLRNIFYLDNKSANKYQSIDSMYSFRVH